MSDAASVDREPVPSYCSSAAIADGPFRRVPPGAGNILVPAWSRRATRAGLALRTPCHPIRVVTHHAQWLLAAVVGARSLRATQTEPGAWVPPMGAGVWKSLCHEWVAALGPFDGIAVYERSQVLRPGIGVLLLHRDRPVAFVKAQTDDVRTALAWRVLRSLTDEPLDGWHVPRPLDHGMAEGWSWLATAAIAPMPHRPARAAPIAAITETIRGRLDGVLDRTTAPDHWAPMHGDLTPWNLRRVGRRSLWLFDWEDARYGPPGADEVFYAATSSMLPGARVPYEPGHDEAFEYWRARARRRAAAGIDAEYNRALAERLGSMSPG